MKKLQCECVGSAQCEVEEDGGRIIIIGIPKNRWWRRNEEETKKI